MMIRKIVLAAFLVAGTAGIAQAGGTPEEQTACRPDVRRFCHSIPPGADDGMYLACLKDHRDKLRRACRQVLESHGQ